jgi:hypothetical protein
MQGNRDAAQRLGRLRTLNRLECKRARLSTTVERAGRQAGILYEGLTTRGLFYEVGVHKKFNHRVNDRYYSQLDTYVAIFCG